MTESAAVYTQRIPRFMCSLLGRVVTFRKGFVRRLATKNNPGSRPLFELFNSQFDDFGSFVTGFHCFFLSGNELVDVN